MRPHFCKVCQRAVRAEDIRCGACGNELHAEDTVPGAFNPAASQRGLPKAAAGGRQAGGVKPPPLRMNRFDGESLPNITDLIAPLDEMITIDLPLPDLSEDAVAPQISSTALAVQVGDIRQAVKAAKRAAVRRARLVQARSDPTGSPCVDVLVLDANESVRSAACQLLEGFGFKPLQAPDTTAAMALLADHAVAAAFVDIAFEDADDGSTLALCHALKPSGAAPGSKPAALVLVSSTVSAVGKVRARMAGFDAVISKPARRGDVARALEACGVAMPSDARRS